MKKINVITVGLIISLFAFITCKQDQIDPPPPPTLTNHSPAANAGPDQKITLPTNSVTLDGNGSFDPDNNIINHAGREYIERKSFAVGFRTR